MTEQPDKRRRAAAVTRHMEFDDNSLLAPLVGEHDRHIARIEQACGVTLHARGNRLAITGDNDSVELAEWTLTDLYERLKKGMIVDPAEVDAALRMARARQGEDALARLVNEDTLIKTRRRHITPRSPAQAAYVRALRSHDLVFGLGPAGTGKTYLAAAVAVAMLLTGRIDRIILSRPAVEAGERLGFLPGDLRDKVDPYLRPLYDALHDMLTPETVAKRLESGEIEIAPLAFMRGRTLSNAFVILDEAQNCTVPQMKMFLTRQGENTHVAVTGDPTQIDLPSGVASGLLHAVEVLRAVEGIAFQHFTEVDVVRHRLVGRIVAAYDAAEARTREGKP